MDKQLPVSAWPEWKIIGKIGEGSFGKVYKAKRCENGKIFYSAIKIITIPSSQNELNSVRSENKDERSVRAYFQGLVDECIQEVNTMENFRGNSHVVSVEDYKVVEYLDDIGWDIYIRMEYLTGFQDYYSEKHLTEEDVIQLGIDMCRALEYCRKLHIIHRDVKPENIFVSRFGEFKLGDFGIARQLERNMSGLSKKGTYSYMAPEMYKGEQYDNRVDIYSLGLVLYKLCNRNRLPFLNLEKQLITYRDKENALTRRVSGEQLPRPAEAAPAFAKIILKACAYRCEDRYQTAEEFRRDLEALRAGTLPDVPEEETRTSEGLPAEKRSPAKTAVHKTAASAPGNKPSSSAVRRNSGTPAAAARKKKKRTAVPPLLAAVVVMAAAVFVLLGMFLRLLFSDSGSRSEDPSRFEVSENVNGDPKELQEELERITKRATTISEELNTYNWVEDEGRRIQYFDASWQLMKVLIYPALSEEDAYEEYYYWNGQMFFAYIWTDDVIDYYYYKNGNLIRWIDENNVCHDYETDNSEYVQRGERYWNRSVEEMERVQNDVSD